MNEALPIVLVSVGVFALIGFMLWRRGSKKKQEAEESAVIRVFSDTLQTTANGVNVYSKDGISDQMLSAIAIAASELFEDARAIGYANALTFHDKIVYVIPADRDFDSDGNYVPNFLIRADDYDGSEFDQDPAPGIGRIYAAEYVIMNPDNTPSSEIIICEYVRDFETSAQEAPRNGWEHILQFHNNRGDYERDKLHTGGNYHPLIRRRSMARGFIGEARTCTINNVPKNVKIVGRVKV